MIRIERLTGYDVRLAEDMGKLLMSLTTKYDGKAVEKEWIDWVVQSPWHDELVAFDEDGKLVGMATLSVVMGAKIDRNAYLEDFVVDAEARGKGIGGKMWEEMLKWGREKGCKRLEFTSSGKDMKCGAVRFYVHKGAEIRDTNFFRVEL